MDLSSGGANPPDDGAGEDRLSELPADVLVLILLRLDTAAAAARTSVLSSRWRRLWALLPELRFPADPGRIRAVLAAHEADLRLLHVGTLDAAPESVAAWLPAAACRLSGSLVFRNRPPERDADDLAENEDNGAFELPCFDRATAISLDLGFLGLAVPPAGVFARLTDLVLNCVNFQGPCELGDAVSSPRCPCLQKLKVCDSMGLLNLAIHSESLLQVHLVNLGELRRLIVVAPALREFRFRFCFGDRQSVANISTPRLESLWWEDLYDPSLIQLGEMAQLQELIACDFLVTGGFGAPRCHGSIIRLFERIRVTRVLGMTLRHFSRQNIGNLRYLREHFTVLPHLMFLNLVIINKGHVFGASVFHMLRMCNNGLKGLLLVLNAGSDLEAQSQSACPSGCICDEPSNWKTDELTLNCLQEVEIRNMKGFGHEVTFLKRLFNWATVLETITFDYSVSESKARELRQAFSSFSNPETRMEFYMCSSARN